MSYFRENIEQASAYVPGFQPQRAEVVKLNTNENPFAPSPRAVQVLSEMNAEQLRRYPDPLGDSFRQVAASVHGLSADHIMCCNGGDDLLVICFRSFCAEDRPVAYPVPTYSLYPVQARLQNCPIIEVPFDGEFNLPPKLASTQAPLTIVCNPNAPSGTLIAPEEMGSLADELQGILLIDEAYVDFAACDCVDLVKRFDNVIILRSLSKGYSLAGIRFGYAIAQPNLIAGLMKVKDSYNVDAMALAVATAALQDQGYFAAQVEKVKALRQAMTQSLRELGFTVGESHTNFVLAQPQGCPARALHEALAQRHIYLRYFDLPGLDDKVRISVGTAAQNEKLILAIKEIQSSRG
jgi:histidinol-phosphate aminotransferase